MINAKTLGRRIKYFRKRAGLSQMELELAMNASAGMISRIESGKVNPSKETVRSLSHILKLNDKELDYLIGGLSRPANQDEINLAIGEVKDYLDKPMTFGYLIDDRFRLLYLSKGFMLMFSKLIPDPYGVLQKMTGNTIAGLMFDNDIGVRQFLKTEFYNDLLFLQLARLKKQMSYMVDDEYYKQVEKLVKRYPDAEEAWNRADIEDVNFNSLDSKRVEFYIYGMKIKMYFSRESVWKYPRFETIEYIPNNRFLKLIQKIGSS